jgi:hypothetical protein
MRPRAARWSSRSIERAASITRSLSEEHRAAALLNAALELAHALARPDDHSH